MGWGWWWGWEGVCGLINKMSLHMHLYIKTAIIKTRMATTRYTTGTPQVLWRVAATGLCSLTSACVLLCDECSRSSIAGCRCSSWDCESLTASDCNNSRLSHSLNSTLFGLFEKQQQQQHIIDVDLTAINKLHQRKTKFDTTLCFIFQPRKSRGGTTPLTNFFWGRGVPS